MIPRLLLLCFGFSTAVWAADSADLFDLSSIRNVSNLEIKVLEDWQPHPTMPDIQQKLVEITMVEWWRGQKVRLPVTLNVPSDPSKLPVKHVLVANMGLTPRVSTPKGASLQLLRENGVGVVGMGTIDAMEPKGQLHLAMKEQLLKTKNPRYSSAWILGMSQMRGLTAAESEPDFFKPEKVISTGGSKRGIATNAAGIHNGRFTGIVPIVAPPHGNPGTPSGIIGAKPAWREGQDRRFLETVEPGVRRSLGLRKLRRETRLTLAEVSAQGWSEEDIVSLNDRIWSVSRITDHLDTFDRRGLEYFFNAGTNDSVIPALVKLGKMYPKFPIYIVPGGQHDGPGDAGYTRRVTIQPEVSDFFHSFCMHHFFDARDLPEIPTISAVRKGNVLVVSTQFSKTSKPQNNELSWSVDRHQPYSLPFEYDRWESVAITAEGENT